MKIHENPCSRCGFHAPGVDFMFQAWISCSRHGFHAPGMDFILQAWISCSSHGLHAPGMDFMLLAWIACSSRVGCEPRMSCSRHRFHAPGMDCMHQAWIACSRSTRLDLGCRSPGGIARVARCPRRDSGGPPRKVQTQKLDFLFFWGR